MTGRRRLLCRALAAGATLVWLLGLTTGVRADLEEPVELSGVSAAEHTDRVTQLDEGHPHAKTSLHRDGHIEALGAAKQKIEHARHGLRAAKRGLGEALRADASIKVNPDCVGPAMPACQHGFVDQDACKCNCPWNWKGKLCEVCDPQACKSGGTMHPENECSCKCAPGFFGDDCGKGSRCLHGGTEVGKTCKCTNAWTGDTCNQCNLVCENGGVMDAAQCTCKCPPARKPPTCAECQDPSCQNGGIFKNGKDEKSGQPMCGCQCPADKAWSGPTCAACTNPGCANGAAWNQAQCKCNCPNENWSGSKCEKCELHCSDGKRRDDATCTCVDGGNVNYNPCVVGCRNGELDTASCTCKCKEGFQGLFCDKCMIEKCFNGGKLQHDLDCSCKCSEPWTGEKCEECPMECGPHGKVKPGCSGCACDASKTGKWAGAKCDKCEHATCANGGHLDEAKCECVCAVGYSGPTCNQCHLKQEDCAHGSALLFDQCKCDCAKGEAAMGDWSGQLCDQCSHAGCENGGAVNQQTCRCDCVPMWMGRYCKACGHAFCNAKPSGDNVKGQNGVADTVNTNCGWVRNDLGCPGGVN